MEQLLLDLSSAVLVFQKGSLHSTLILIGVQMKLFRLIKLFD
jgi:hypothetical protein